MDWKSVGKWLKNNAGTGAALVGSLLTGNVAGAVATGVSLVSSATGTTSPAETLAELQGNPETLVRLKEIAAQEEQNIRLHIAEMERLRLEDEQKQHETTQETIREGDKADDKFVRRTRPGQSWCSLFAAFAYVFTTKNPDMLILSALLTLPLAYAGLRQVDKSIFNFTKMKEKVGGN